MLGPLDFGIHTICNLTIAYVNSSDAVSNSSILDAAKAVSAASKGFDLLLTADWPRDMHHFLEEIDLQEINALGIGYDGKKSSLLSILIFLNYNIEDWEDLSYLPLLHLFSNHVTTLFRARNRFSRELHIVILLIPSTANI